MTHTGVLLLASAMLILTGIASANAAQKVGVAAAVNPDAFASGRVVNLGKSIFFNEQVKTSANGLVQVLLIDGSTFTVGPNSNLVIDKFVYDPAKGQGEMVATFSKGALRFVGGKLSKKQGGVTVKTPEGALAIRGGIAQIQVSAGGSKFLFDFGDQMQLQGNDGQTHTIFQPGNLIDVTGGSPFVRPTNPEDTQYFLTQLASKPGQSGGVGPGGGPSNGQTESGMGGQGAGGSTPPPVGNEIENQIFTVKIEDATSDEIQQDIVEEINKTPPPVMTGDPPPPPAGNDPPPPGPPQVQLRVLSLPDVFTSFIETSDERSFGGHSENRSPGNAGILGGDNNLSVTSDDFVTTATIVGGALQGSVQLVDYNECDHSQCEPTTVLGPVQQFAFSYNPANDEHDAVGFVFQVEGDEVFIDNIFVGSQVSRPGFLAYQMYEVDLESVDTDGPDFPEINPHEVGINFDDPLRIVSGEEYVLPTQGKLHSIALLTDPRQNQGGSDPIVNGFVVPFASAESMPKDVIFPIPLDYDRNDPEAQLPPADKIPAVSNLLLLEKDSDKPTVGSLSVWMQTSFYIGTNSESGEQENFVVLALGGVEERDGFDALVGQRRGGSQLQLECCDGVGQQPRQISFAGGIASLAGGEGAHLMGADGVNIVVSADSTGDGHKIFVDRPLDGDGSRSFRDGSPSPPGEEHGSYSGEEYMISPPPSGDQYATYHIGTQNGPAVSVEQSDGDFQGYAVGMVESLSLSQPNIVMSTEASDVTFSFDPESNTLSAKFRVYDQGNDGATDRYEIGFGGIEESGKSAFIDNQRFAAIENLDETRVIREDGTTAYSHSNAESYLVSGDQLDVTSFFPAVFEKAPNSDHRPFCQNCDFIKWGAWGTRVQFGASQSGSYDDNVHMGWWVAGDVTKEADLASLGNKSADYAGHAIGNVANNGSNYVAAGDMAMHWEFGPRTGRWDVSNFDGNRSFGADIGAANARTGNHFGNLVEGQPNPNIDVNGSFVNDGSGNAARGVIGDFSVNGQGYSATGIFAGSGTPVPGLPLQ